MSAYAESFDVAIVGASLAGSAAALRLSQAGLSVALIDKSYFPRAKACGEGLSRFGLLLLHALGVPTSTLIDDANSYYGYRFVHPVSPHRTCTARANTARGWGIRRSTLDSALVALVAKQATTQLFLHHTVRNVRHDGRMWSITHDSASLSARYVFLAAGAAADTLAREYVTTTHLPSDRVGYTLHAKLLSGTLPRVVTVLPSPGGEIYITCVASQELNISLVGSTDFIRLHRDADQLAILLESSLAIQVSFSALGSGGSHFQVRRTSTHPSLYLLGDAAESFDPACGLGMTHALYTGILAADSVIAGLGGTRSPDGCQAEYVLQQKHFSRGIRYFSFTVRGLMRLFRVAPRFMRMLSGPSAGKIMEIVEWLTLSKVAASPDIS